MQSVIKIENLRKYFRYGIRGIGIQAVDGISLEVEEGEVFGLLGPNGAGKSTTIKIILGLTRQNSGKCLLFGKEMARQTRKDIGYLPESPYFYKFLTGFELVVFYAKLCGMSNNSAKNAAMKALNLVGLDDAANRQIALYSKGMVQRAGLAQAIVHNPRLLILDEPINGLDPIGIAEVRDFIRELCDATGKTILISSHILSEISLLADDIGIIDHGVLLEEESLKELEAKNGKYLRFTVSNAALAANLLQSKLGIQNIEVDSANELTVRDLRLDTGAAVRLFVDAGLSVSDAHLYEDTLEDYFKQVTGGEGIA